jgi:predicted dehydrogenase
MAGPRGFEENWTIGARGDSRIDGDKGRRLGALSGRKTANAASRRDFLRNLLVAGAGAAVGCAGQGNAARPPTRLGQPERSGAATSNISIRGGTQPDRQAVPDPRSVEDSAAGELRIEDAAPAPAVSRPPMDEGAVLRCAMVGVGGWGSALLQGLLDRSDVQVVAVADAYDVWRDRALTWCKNGGGARGYVEYAEMLDTETVDAVFIAAPDHIHGPAVRAALAHGLDVYVESPLALTWEESKALHGQAVAAGAIVQMGTQWRSEAMYRYARAVIQKGDIGDVIAVEVQRHYTDQLLSEFEPPREATAKNVHWKAFLGESRQRPFDLVRFFRWSRFREYSNAHMGMLLAPHLDMCHFLTGCGMPETVMAAGGNYRFDDGRTSPDTFSVLAAYPEAFHFNYICAPAAGPAGVIERYLGSDGSIEVFDMSRLAVFRKDSREDWKAQPSVENAHVENFLDAVRRRIAPEAPVGAGFMESAFSHLAMLSLESGRSMGWDRARASAIPGLPAGG